MARLLTLVTVLALGAGALACGSDPDGDDAKNDSARAANSTTASVPTRSGGDPDGTPDEQVRATYDTLVDALYAKKTQSVCDLLTPAAEKRLAEKSTCAKKLTNFIDSLGGGLIKDRPKVIKVTIRGDRALARAKTRKSNAYTIPFLNNNGTWQIDGGFETAGL
ncbi:MAG TPA: hypothetical protein VGF45_16725 [Polyangia bacterium]